MPPQINIGGSMGVPGNISFLGFSDVVVPDANITLTPDEAAVLFINAIGTLTATRNVFLPSNKGQIWILQNNTTGDSTIDFVDILGQGVVNVNPGDSLLVYIDPNGTLLPVSTISTDLEISDIHGDSISANDGSSGTASIAQITYTGSDASTISTSFTPSLNTTTLSFEQVGIPASILYQDGGLNVQINGALRYTFAPVTISDVTSTRSFGTAFQNTSNQDMQVSGWGTTTGSATGALQVKLGPANPPTVTIWQNENTASVLGADTGFSFIVPPGFWYLVNASGNVTALGGWVETTF